MMKVRDNFILGLFVTIGIACIVFLFYIVSKRNTFWSSSFELKAQFRDVQGLQKGNNVRYAGMQIGTVKNIIVLNDSTIEVSMEINESAKKFIHKDAVAEVTADGFVGDKLINISGGNSTTKYVSDGDLIQAKTFLLMDQLSTLIDSPEQGVKSILFSLNQILKKIDSSSALQALSSDQKLLSSIRITLSNFQNASHNTELLTSGLNSAINAVNNGKGIINATLTDTIYAKRLDTIMKGTTILAKQANVLMNQLTNTVQLIDNDLNYSHGLAYTVLRDSIIAKKLEKSVNEIQVGVSSFAEILEAIKGSFLLRHRIKKNSKSKIDTTAIK